MQSCVVTLDPVEAEIGEPFDIVFAQPSYQASEAGEVLDPESDLPEPLPPEGLDLGEVVAQQLALALDPYPRSVTADEALREVAGPEGDTQRRSPFEVLRGLK